MGPAVRPELALDLGPPSSGGFVPQREAAPGEGRAAKLEEYVRRLEEERRKIEVFRRELPLCMLILNDTIEGVKEELAGCRDGGGGGRPALEEFMPVNAKLEEAEGGVRDEKDFRDKVNWMSSAQLWSDNYSANTSSTTSTTVASSSNSQKKGSERAAEDRSGGGGGGAFLPFKEMAGKEKAAAVALPPPDLSLLSPATKASSSGEHQRSGGSISLTRVSSRGTGMASPAGNEQPPPSHQAAPRKPRRCWSPELHRRFVNALQQLGGAQGSATPKQIRELMKVDGLTNDEVKSHLQKYRLHTRRLPSSSSPEKHPMMVLGGLWAPPENFPLLKQATGSPQGPLHLANAGEDSGEEEDGRSESYSWKGHLQRPAGEETD